MARKKLTGRKVHGVGINDVLGLLSSENIAKNPWHMRAYMAWKGMLRRCYCSSLDHYQWYKDCSVCERWIKLSNFLEDIQKLDGFEFWRDNPNLNIALDKDAKIKGNKVYSPEACQFLSIQNNVAEAMKNRDYLCPVFKFRGEVKPRGVLCTYPDGTRRFFKSAMNAEREGGFNHSRIASCCRGRIKTHLGCKFEYSDGCF